MVHLFEKSDKFSLQFPLKMKTLLKATAATGTCLVLYVTTICPVFLRFPPFLLKNQQKKCFKQLTKPGNTRFTNINQLADKSSPRQFYAFF